VRVPGRSAEEVTRASRFPVKLTQAQRKAVAEIAPEFADRLKLDEKNQRTSEFTLAEVQANKVKASTAVGQPGTGTKRNSLRAIVASTSQAIDRSESAKRVVSTRLGRGYRRHPR